MSRIKVAYETEKWPIVLAKNYKDIAAKRAVRVIVIHTMEAPEGPQTAENVANWFKNQRADEGPSSAHVCIDNNSIIQCVMDNDVAYAAPGANHDGIQIELAGTAKQSLKQWLDDYSLILLNKAADVVAQYCHKYGVAARHLTDTELRQGAKGIIGHVQASRVYKLSNHTDPGSFFPWDMFMAMVRYHLEIRRK
jgi:N-acetyl-anhydromuramyl-L-alanine amidase AmpD